jgi:nucleotide-binding universal stress UspA family protein
MNEKHNTGPILVPVDFSKPSEAALTQAVELARCLKRPLLVLHVVHDPGNMPGYYNQALKKKHLMRIEDSAAEMLEAFVKPFVKAHAGQMKHVQLESTLVTGLPTSRILEVAKETGAAMIVMGSIGLTGWKRLMIGSVAEQVVHLSPIPVTVVKAETKKGD